jgi:hypothetical protein
MQTKNSSLSATYNGKKLIRVVEKNTKMSVPNAVLYSIYNTYCLTCINDKYLYTQEEGVFWKKTI